METGSLEGKFALSQGLTQIWPPPRGRGLGRIDLDSLEASLPAPPPAASMVSQIWGSKVSSKASWGRRSLSDGLSPWIILLHHQPGGLCLGGLFMEHGKGTPAHFSQASPCTSLSPAWQALLLGPQ